MIKKAVKILKSKKGVSTHIGMLFSFVILILFFSCYLGYNAHIYNISGVDRFAESMANKVSQLGRCKGNDIDKYYNQLAEDTGIKPIITYEANFYNSNKKTVQYGDEITVIAELETKLIGFGDFNIPKKLKATATKTSYEYWK